MKIIFLCLFALLSIAYYANTVHSSAVCHSTGDPHYKTYTGYAANLYNPGGDYLLTKTANGKFSVVTRVGYSKNWANQGVNTAFAVKVDNNRIEHYGNFYKVNGNKNKIVPLKNGAKLSVSGNKWIIQSKDGIVTDVNIVDLRNTKDLTTATHYFNIVVRVPTSYKGQLSGLCGTYVSKAIDTALWKKTSQFMFNKIGGGNLFTVKYYKHNHLSYKPNPIVLNKWNDAKYRAKVYDFCRKLKLTGSLFDDCVYDIRISGKFTVSSSYTTVAKDIALLNNHKDNFTKGIAGAKKTRTACLTKAKQHKDLKTRKYLVKSCRTNFRKTLAELSKVHKCGGFQSAYAKEIRLANHYLNVYRSASTNKDHKKAATYLKSYQTYTANAKKTLVTLNKCKASNATVNKCASYLKAYRQYSKNAKVLKNKEKTTKIVSAKKAYKIAYNVQSKKAKASMDKYRECSKTVKPIRKPTNGTKPKTSQYQCSVFSQRRNIHLKAAAAQRAIYNKFTANANNYQRVSVSQANASKQQDANRRQSISKSQQYYNKAKQFKKAAESSKTTYTRYFKLYETHKKHYARYSKQAADELRLIQSTTSKAQYHKKRYTNYYKLYKIHLAEYQGNLKKYEHYMKFAKSYQVNYNDPSEEHRKYFRAKYYEFLKKANAYKPAYTRHFQLYKKHMQLYKSEDSSYNKNMNIIRIQTNKRNDNLKLAKHNLSLYQKYHKLYIENLNKFRQNSEKYASNNKLGLQYNQKAAQQLKSSQSHLKLSKQSAANRLAAIKVAKEALAKYNHHLKLAQADLVRYNKCNRCNVTTYRQYVNAKNLALKYSKLMKAQIKLAQKHSSQYVKCIRASQK